MKPVKRNDSSENENTCKYFFVAVVDLKAVLNVRKIHRFKLLERIYVTETRGR